MIDRKTFWAAARGQPLPVRVEPQELPLAAKLDGLTHKSLAKAHEILDMPLDPMADNADSRARVQAGVVNTIVGAKLKAEENSLRKETVDRLPEILALIAEELADREQRRLASR